VSGISSHVLDTSIGAPATAVQVRLDVSEADGAWRSVATARTDSDGRAQLAAGPLARATYRVTFETGAYFEATRRPIFYPLVEVIFRIDDAGAHYHVPLLLSPFGYCTYRGS